MTAGVLVLNSTYEPISYTRLGRAIALIERGDAVIEEAHERVLRHARGEMLWPKVVRLLRYVKISVEYGPAGWTKAGVLKRDNHECAYCGKHATTVDHVVPLSHGGGPRDWLNTVAACVKCNAKKRNRTPKQAHMTLRITPETPYVTRVRLGGKRVKQRR